MPANTLKATPNGVAFNVYYAGHWPPRQFGGRWFIHRASSDFPDRFIPFEGRFFGGCSCRASAVLGLAGLLSSSLFITGAYLIAISGPIQGLFVFNDLRCLVCPGFLHYGMPSLVIMQKAIETCPPAPFGGLWSPTLPPEKSERWGPRFCGRSKREPPFFTVGISGRNAFPCPKPQSAGLEPGIAGMAGRFEDKHSARVGRSRGLHRRRRNPTPTSLPGG